MRQHWPHHRVRRYYGAHLHRRLFLWFGFVILVTAFALGGLPHLLGLPPGPRPGRGVGFLVTVCVVLWAASGVIARRIARPLEELIRVTKDIGGGKLSARADLSCGGIGEIAILSRAVNDMAARIERQLSDQRELLAGVSHEIRTPLARIRLLLELGRNRPGGDPAAAAKVWDELDREVIEIDALVGELLASARLDFATLSPKPLDAVEIGSRALERVGLPADRLVIDAGAADGSGAIRFPGDPTLIARALANLLDNARKHGGGARALRIGARPGFVTFEVEDRGPGFPAGDPARFFRSFTRGARETERHEGSLGLGLALVERIAKAHGGQVVARNGEAGGALVVMELARGG